MSNPEVLSRVLRKMDPLALFGVSREKVLHELPNRLKPTSPNGPLIVAFEIVIDVDEPTLQESRRTFTADERAQEVAISLSIPAECVRTEEDAWKRMSFLERRTFIEKDLPQID